MNLVNIKVDHGQHKSGPWSRGQWLIFMLIGLELVNDKL